MLFPGGKTHALALSYDDACDQDLRLIEMLRAHGVKCTFNLNSGCFAKEGTVYPPGVIPRRMTRSQCLAAYSSPLIEVASHTVTHAVLPNLPGSAAVTEILNDRIALESMFGKPVRGLAYPCSRLSDDVMQMLRLCGICYARGGDFTHGFRLPENDLAWMSTCPHRDPDLMALADSFLSEKIVYDGPLLFMLEGHSYEFEQAGNWSVMERFLALMGGRPEIWYATCQEIFDAKEAYRRLYFTADGKTAFNPSHCDVWLLADGKPCVVPGGGSLRLP